MYPKNSASPPRIAIGAVVQISDGAVQSSGVSVAVRPEGGSESAGGGTTSYGGSSNVVYYVPTQAETNCTAFVVTAYKTGCIPVSVTVITTESTVAGRVYVGTVATDAIDAASLKADAIAEIQSGLSTLTQAQVTGGAYALNSASFAFNGALDFTTTQKAATLARVTLVDTTTTNTDMRGTDNAALAATALSTTQWTNTLATNLGTTNSTVATNLDATVSSRLASASYTAAPSAATNGSAVRTELTSELLVMTRLGTAIVLDGAVYQFTTNALENAPGGSTTVSVMPVSGSATTGNVLDGGRIKGQYGAPLTGLAVTCTTTTAGVTSARDLTAYDGALAFVVFDNDDTMDYGTRIVNGADITVSSNVATISSTASHVLNTALGENLRWCLREDTAAPSIVFAIGDYTCQRAPVTA